MSALDTHQALLRGDCCRSPPDAGNQDLEMCTTATTNEDRADNAVLIDGDASVLWSHCLPSISRGFAVSSPPAFN